MLLRLRPRLGADLLALLSATGAAALASAAAKNATAAAFTASSSSACLAAVFIACSFLRRCKPAPTVEAEPPTASHGRYASMADWICLSDVFLAASPPCQPLALASAKDMKRPLSLMGRPAEFTRTPLTMTGAGGFTVDICGAGS